MRDINFIKIFLLAIIFLSGASAGRVSAQSALDGFDPNADEAVREILILANLSDWLILALKVR